MAILEKAAALGLFLYEEQSQAVGGTTSPGKVRVRSLSLLILVLKWRLRRSCSANQFVFDAKHLIFNKNFAGIARNSVLSARNFGQDCESRG
jgi:hypothetical protein